MGDSIAVLVGNAKYLNLSQLDCCARDVLKMRELLESTKKFSQIINLIDVDVDSAKEAIRGAAQASSEVSEIFFYFSGHGLSNVDDFYMCFANFSETSPNSSGLSRTEAYNLLRSFNAEVSVAVIDACEAGRNLIKRESSPIAALPKGGFKSFLQFASCMETQYSIAGEDLSLFTSEFLKACSRKDDGVVYYSDIENALRDAFLNHPAQTPHFVKQGNGQEQFCSDASYLHALRAVAPETKPTSDSVETIETLSELDRAMIALQAIEEKIPTKDEAQNFINSVFSFALENVSLDEEFSRFFSLRTVKYQDYGSVSNKKSIVELIRRRGGSDDLVEVDIETKTSTNMWNSSIANFLAQQDPTTIYHLWNRSGLNSLHVGLYFEPTLLALNRIFSEIVFVPRLSECLILTSNVLEKRDSWDTFSEASELKKWKWSAHSWRDDPAHIASKFVADPYTFAKNYVISFGQ